MGEPIRFYRVRDAYGEFSNFAAFPITIDCIEWRTTEHYFQAQKFVGTEHAEEIRLTPSALVAARKARSRQRPLRVDWESVKVDVMRTALRAKFSQHTSLRDLLLATGEAPIVEHTADDGYWGDGGDGSGRSMLGRLLMEVRAELAGESTSTISTDPTAPSAGIHPSPPSPAYRTTSPTGTPRRSIGAPWRIR